MRPHFRRTFKVKPRSVLTRHHRFVWTKTHSRPRKDDRWEQKTKLFWKQSGPGEGGDQNQNSKVTSGVLRPLMWACQRGPGRCWNLRFVLLLRPSARGRQTVGQLRGWHRGLERMERHVCGDPESPEALLQLQDFGVEQE